MRGWAKDLLWFIVIVTALVIYGAVTGVPWPIAVVSSYSMEPTLKMGDFIIIAGATCRTVSVGDVVVYVAKNPLWGGSWVIHRAVDKREEICGLVTKGDNNPYPDQAAGEPLVTTNIVGKLALAVPYVGVFPLIVRPQGVGVDAAAAWLGRLALFGAAVHLFYLYFKPAPRKKKARK